MLRPDLEVRQRRLPEHPEIDPANVIDVLACAVEVDVRLDDCSSRKKGGKPRRRIFFDRYWLTSIGGNDFL